MPKLIGNDFINELDWVFRPEEAWNKTKRLDIILLDPINSSILKYDFYQMSGNTISVKNSEDTGLKYYRVKLSLQTNIENNPNFRCKSYSHEYSYERCLTEAFSELYIKCLSCIPPWLADANEEQKICKHILSLDDEKHKNCPSKEMIDGLVDFDNCPKPCSVMKYEVKRVSEVINDGLTGAYIMFENDIETTYTSFMLDPVTVLSRLGGVIGVGKETFWTIMLTYSAIKLLYSSIKFAYY